ncbi:MAG: hypothetical protein ABI656_11170 [bacterium]
MDEVSRITFLIDRDGIDSAIEWVRRTLRIYRSSVLNRKHFASSHGYRRRFIESYLSFKRWLGQQV